MKAKNLKEMNDFQYLTTPFLQSLEKEKTGTCHSVKNVKFFKNS